MGLNSLGLGIILSMRDAATIPARRAAGALGQLDTAAIRFSQTANNALATAFEGMNMIYAGVLTTLGPATFVKATFESQKALSSLSSIGVEELKYLKEASLDFSNTWGGTMRSEFLDTAYFIKGGISTLSDQAVADFTTATGIIAKATRSTMSELQNSIPTMYGILKPVKKELTDAQFISELAGGLANAVNIFKSTGKDMGDSFSQLTSIATAARVPMEEQITILGMLQQTMSGSEAGTKYRALVRGAAHASAEAKKFGLTVTDSEGRLLPIANLMENIKNKFGTVISMQNKWKLQQIFGSDEATAVIDNLLPNIDLLKKSMGQIKDSMQQGLPFAQKMAEIVNNNPADHWEVLVQQLHNLKEIMGEALIPMFGTIIKGASYFILALQGIAKKYPLIIQFVSSISMLAGTILIFTGTIFILNAALKLINGSLLLMKARLAILRTEFLAFMATMWPLIAVAGLLYIGFKTNFMGMKTGLEDFVKSAQRFFGKVKLVWQGLRELFSTLTGSKGYISAETKDMLEKAGLWEITKKLFMLGYRIKMAYQGFIKGFSDFWNTVTYIAKPIGKIILDYIITPFAFLFSWLGMNMPLLQVLISPSQKNIDVWRKFGEILGWVGGILAGWAIINVVSSILGLVRVIWGAIAAVWAFNVALWMNPLTWIVAAVIALIAGIALLIIYWDDVKAAVVNAIKVSLEWITNLGKKIGNWFVTIFTNAINGIKILWNDFIEAIKNIAHSFDFVGDMLNNLKDRFWSAINWIHDKWNGLINGITDNLPDWVKKQLGITVKDETVKSNNGSLPKMATGGSIISEGAFHLHSGEFVMNADLTKRFSAIANSLSPAQKYGMEPMVQSQPEPLLADSNGAYSTSTINNIYNNNSINRLSSTSAQPGYGQMNNIPKQETIIKLEIPVNLDGREITRVIANHIDRERRRG